MRILDHNSAHRQLTRQAMESASELRVRELCHLGDEMLQDIDGTCPQMDELLRFDVTRIFSRCHEILSALTHHDPARAYAIAQGGDIRGASA